MPNGIDKLLLRGGIGLLFFGSSIGRCMGLFAISGRGFSWISRLDWNVLVVTSYFASFGFW